MKASQVRLKLWRPFKTHPGLLGEIVSNRLNGLWPTRRPLWLMQEWDFVHGGSLTRTGVLQVERTVLRHGRMTESIDQLSIKKNHKGTVKVINWLKYRREHKGIDLFQDAL
jgi:hypothetical protein